MVWALPLATLSGLSKNLSLTCADPLGSASLLDSLFFIDVHYNKHLPTRSPLYIFEKRYILIYENMTSFPNHFAVLIFNPMHQKFYPTSTHKAMA